MSAASSTPEERRSPALELLRRRPLVSFFVLSYAVTWLLWSPVVILGLPVFEPSTAAPNPAVLPAIAIGVTGTAVFMIWVTEGRDGLRRYRERLLTWRVGIGWWAVAILALPVGGMIVATLLGASDTLLALTPAALVSYPLAYLAHFVFGPLFEESGWRGFALPRMQYRLGPARGTLVLGLLWSAWHFFLYAPMWFGSDLAAGLQSLIIFSVLTTAMTFLFTWLSNHTRASLLLVILLHGSVDGTQTYMTRLGERGVIDPASAQLANGLGLLIAAVVIMIVLLVATRTRLGYGAYRDTWEEARDLDPVTAAAPRGGRAPTRPERSAPEPSA
ncbi:CPBP family intramembrane glutamic endopeptidase [Actinomycetospora termitidis]|uniref:Type II CAAX endopeptidase family protein n=1 Tax=Actinomycetospora termitidis TaxID=3053470 RepID=A0ABT7M692_9PSEU|nr:type II CAAX endopeptidase family protein [Actinomycetospora sp. Odt1-22]MDL5156186.1 type II CAAX endopeptidase family protein [Actinomycetospora sp. Odt1-22]